MPTNMIEFVTTDTAKALRITVKDSDGNIVNLTGAAVKLFAEGVASGDKPGTGGQGLGLDAVITDAPNGVAEVQGLGAKCTPGSGRRADIYFHRVRVVSGGTTTWHVPVGHFVCWNAPA